MNYIRRRKFRFMFSICFRYIGAHYVAFMAAFAEIAYKNYDPHVSYQIYVVALLALACVFLVVKMLIGVVKMVLAIVRGPIYDDPSLNGTDEETKVTYSTKGHIHISVISQ